MRDEDEVRSGVRISREERGQTKDEGQAFGPCSGNGYIRVLTWAFQALRAWPRTGPGTSDRPLKLEGEEAIRGHTESRSGAASGSGPGWT